MTDRPVQTAMVDPMAQRWYPQPDDLIGGWCVMNVDKPPSQADPCAGEVEVACFLSRQIARHVAGLHNATLAKWLGID